MAILNFADLFDFGSYNAAIKELETENKNFGSSVTSMAKEIQNAYKGISGELKVYADTLRSMNVNQAGAAQTIRQISQDTDVLVKRQQQQKNAYQELLNIQNLNNRSLGELKAAAKQLEKEYSSLGGASVELNAKKAALAKEYQRITEAAKQQAQVLKVSSKVVDDATDSYRSWQSELSRIGKELKSMPDAFDKTTGKINQNNKAAVDLSNRYIVLNDRLKQSDAALGNFQRNVGNYKSGFSGLSNSVNQITREFPAFTNSVQTGFLAISNNLPIFFDQLKATKTELAAMRAEGQKVPSLFQALTSSIFSWGTALSLGVTLLTVFGGDIVKFVGSAFKGKQAIDEIAERQKLYNEVLKDANQQAGKQLVDARLLYEAAVNTNLSMKERLEAVTALKKEFPEYFKQISTEKILNGEAKDSYDKLTESILKASRATAAKSKLDQIESQKLDIEDQKQKIRNANSREVKNARTEYFGGAGGGATVDVSTVISASNQRAQKALAEQDALLKSLNDRQKFLIDFVGAENLTETTTGGKKDGKKGTPKDKYGEQIKDLQEALQRNAELQISAQEQLLSDQRITEDSFLLTKYNITKAYVDKAIQYEESRGKKKDESKILELKKRTQDAYNDYLSAYRKAEMEAISEDEKLTKEQLEKRNKESIQAIEEEKQLQLIALQEGRDLAITSKILTDKEKAGLELEYQNKIDEITIDALRARSRFETDEKKKENEKIIAELQAKINTRQAEFDAKAAKDASADKRKLLEDDLALYQRLFDQINRFTDGFAGAVFLRIAYLEKYYKRKEELALTDEQRERVRYEKNLALIAAYSEAAIQSINVVGNLIQDSSNARIQAIERQKQVELDNAGSNAAAREKIEKEFNKRIAAEKTKQARIEKMLALFSIGINTATAVIAALKPPPVGLGPIAGIPLSIAVGGIGLAQAALVASRPIPKYKRGRKRGPAEAAIVDEIGSELIVDKHGRLREVGSNKGPRLTYLNQDDQVIPAHEKEDYLSKMIFDHKTSNIDLENNLFRAVTGKIESSKQLEAIHVMARAIKKGGISETVMREIMKEALKHIVIEKNIWDERGYMKRIESINSRTTHLNDLSKI